MKVTDRKQARKVGKKAENIAKVGQNEIFIRNKPKEMA